MSQTIAMEEKATFSVTKMGYLSGNRTASKRSIVITNILVIEAITEKCPKNLFTVLTKKLLPYVTWKISRGRYIKLTVKSEHAKLDMIKSGILRRLSDLETARMTKEFPMLPETLAKEQMIERMTTDSVDNSGLLELRPFSALLSIEGLGPSLLVLFVNMTGNDRCE